MEWYGIERIVLDLNGMVSFRIGYKLTHQKGKVNGNIPMNAIQPTTSVYNLGYSTEGDKHIHKSLQTSKPVA